MFMYLKCAKFLMDKVRINSSHTIDFVRVLLTPI